MSRTAVITGGVSGLGLATAKRLVEDDITTITIDIASGADVVVDITDPTAVARAAAEIGPVDILINSAGIVGPKIDENGRRHAL